MISIEVKGLDNLIDRLERAGHQIGDWTPFWTDYAQAYIEAYVENIFYTVYPGRLIDTGRYIRSVTQRSADTVSEASPDRFVFGTEVPYVKYLEGRFPVLSLLAENPTFEAGLEALAETWVQSIVGEI